jgi:hypothetical protein
VPPSSRTATTVAQAAATIAVTAARTAATDPERVGAIR